MKTWRKVFALVLVFAMVLAYTVTAFATDDVSGETLETPRDETVYIGGLQKTGSSNNNPFAVSGSYFAVSQSANAREVEFESLYMSNMLDAQIYPLVAADQPVWSEDKTEITVPLRTIVTWSDGTPCTANDYVTTWNTHIEMQTNIGVDFGQYISSVEAIDDYTIVIKANKENHNPLKMKELLTTMYVCQAAYIEAAKETYPDSESFKVAEFFDMPHTGPYGIVYWDTNSKVIYERNDDYWGQAEEMWGELPHPKFVAANIYSGNDAENVAFQQGEIDCSQGFISNIWTLWEDMGLPITTYLDELPYFVDASMPSIWFNTQKEIGTNEVAVRKAIAMAVDYNQIIASAMSGYSPTFAECPHSLFNPTPSAQELYAECNKIIDLESLNFAGKDYEGAKALLDEAGIVDTDGDGWREYNGENMSFTIECPTGWTDWTASCEIVAAAGAEIGIEITTYFPEPAVFYEDWQTGNYELCMWSFGGVGPSQPWAGAYNVLYGWGGNFPERLTNGISRWYNAEADELLAEIPMLDEGTEEYYQAWARLNEIYLTEVPSFAVMYRPQWFYQNNETVWTGFPEQDDGSNCPPACLVDGYGVKGLYMLELVEG